MGRRKILYAIILTLVIAVTIELAVILNSILFKEQGFQAEGEVAIVDQFYRENPDFSDRAIRLLENHDIKSDLYQNVDVELYRWLPSLGYKLIVLRVHSGNYMRTENTSRPATFLYTNENYDPKKYTIEQLKGQVRPGFIREGPQQGKFFTIMPEFVRSAMQGRFENSVVVISSCYVFNTPDLVEALHGKGARAVIGWENGVALEHTDEGTLSLLKSFLDNSTIGEAVREVMEEAGPDPWYGSTLKYYPSESENFVPVSLFKNEEK